MDGRFLYTRDGFSASTVFEASLLLKTRVPYREQDEPAFYDELIRKVDMAFPHV
jgi:hypothetical protein